MFSDLIDPLRRNIGVRLSFLYALIFTLSSTTLFTLAYYLLVAAIGSKDREVLAARLTEAAAADWVNSSPAAYCNTTDGSILRQVLPAFDQETTDFYRWTVTYTQAELAALLQ